LLKVFKKNLISIIQLIIIRFRLDLGVPKTKISYLNKKVKIIKN